jgi:hypothetical protein
MPKQTKFPGIDCLETELFDRGLPAPEQTKVPGIDCLETELFDRGLPAPVLPWRRTLPAVRL